MNPPVIRVQPVAMAELRDLAQLIKTGSASPPSSGWRLAVAPIATLIGFVLQLLILPQPAIAPFVLAYIAVVVASWLGGRAAGMIAVGLSAALANYAFLGRPWQWARLDDELLATGLYLIGSSFVALLCSSFRDAACQAEQMTRAMKRQSDLLELAQDAIFVFGRDTGIEAWNRGAEDLYGYSPSEVRGLRSQDLLDTEFSCPLDEIEHELGESGRWEGELVHKKKGGQPIHVWARLQRVCSEDGREQVLETTRDITKQKQAERALRERQEFLSFALAVANTGAWDLDLKTHTTRRSIQHDRIFGYDELLPEWTFELFLQHVLPEDREAVAEAFRKAVATGTDWNFECRIRRHDGQKRWIWAAGRHQVDGESKPERMAGIVQDITSRKDVEEALRQERDFGAAVVDTAGALIVVLDRDRRILRFNRACEQATGYSAREVEGRPFEFLIAPDHEPELKRRWEALVSGVPQSSYEIEWSRKDGSRRMIAYSISVITGPDGKYEHAIATGIDVTDREQAENALRTSQERLALALGVAQAGSFDWDPRTNVDVWSDQLLSLYGFERGQFGGRHEDWIACVAPEDRAIAVTAADRALETGSFDLQFRIRRHDTGELRWMYGRAETFFDEAHRPIRMIGINVDVSERKQAEEALQQANDRLREADRRKDEFISMLSHELRNPLGPIRNSLVVLDRAAPGSDQARRAKAVIERQVDHMTRLVADLLDVTRVTRGKIQLQREHVDLCQIVSRSVEDHRLGFGARRITLRLENSDRPVWIDGDPMRLGQALGNLLHNAAKFSDEGSTVTVSVVDEGPVAAVTVRDAGVGIAPEILDRLFEPFTQADRSLDRAAGGLGLGLTLVKGLVELHGGTVHARSAGLGNGAEFTFRIPVSDPVRAVDLETEAVAGQARRVLVIEDNMDAAQTLKEVLELDKHEVEVAFSGPEGLEKARTFDPDVVLCDIGLPGMDGYDVARAFRKDLRLHGVALVALTGYALPEDQTRAADAGFDRHLAKPPDIGVLERVLAELEAPHAA